MSKSGPSKKAPAHSPAKAVDPQLAAFEEAVQLFHRREFAAAMPLFVEAGKGPNLDVGQTAQMHARMCQQRLGNSAEPALSSAEDYYTYGLALTNQRKLAAAETALTKEPAWRRAPTTSTMPSPWRAGSRETIAAPRKASPAPSRFNRPTAPPPVPMQISKKHSSTLR
ncbi:MAG: hypothetical protein NTX13_16580 [Acidobacteria bacterium]|nr:hypothetical protein [Acidobacteriota bacterium]